MPERIAVNPTPARFHYSRLIRVGDLLFIAGHVARDHRTGEIEAGGIVEQTALILEQFKEALEAAGSSLGKTAKVNVYLVRKEDFEAFNACYARYFPSDPPVRTTVITELLPKGALIEMDAIATM